MTFRIRIYRHHEGVCDVGCVGVYVSAVIYLASRYLHMHY